MPPDDHPGPSLASASGSRIHVAGNAVVDVLIPGVVGEARDAADGWNDNNVRFLDTGPDCVLGGNGAGVAYALGRLGNRVTLNTRVGVDAFGRMLRAWLEEASVELCGQPSDRTAVNTILLPGDGTRHSLYYTGERVEWRASLNAGASGWYYASGYGQVGPEDLEALSEVFETVRSIGSRVVFDPGPWFFSAASPQTMARAWQHVDCLVGTEQELQTWRDATEPEDILRQILDMGVPSVVMKRGPGGAAYGRAGAEVETIAADPIVSPNTTGAGDTFNAGLIHRLAAGHAEGEAVRCALSLAARAVRSGRGALGAFEHPDGFEQT